VPVIPDVHGNMDALRTVLEAPGRYDEVWLLDNLVDYRPEPGEVID